jgi:hypothetical protein
MIRLNPDPIQNTGCNSQHYVDNFFLNRKLSIFLGSAGIKDVIGTEDKKGVPDEGSGDVDYGGLQRLG